MNDPDLQARCVARLSQHRPMRAAAVLSALAAHPAAGAPADLYGGGGAVAELEQRTAQLLGKPAAMFFIKGMIAQMSVLRVAAERARSANVVLHPMSHIVFDEQDAISRLHHLRPIHLGRYAPFSLAQLDTVTEPIAALVVELPLRRSGYRLPALEELRAISAWARDRGVHLHFDGARLWEAAAGYGIPLPELAGLADSVYVSFYKGLGGLGGAAVAGEASFVRALEVWKGRHGGNLYTAFPYALSALRGLDEQLPRMATYVDRARALASLLAEEGRLALTPRVPEVNAFHLLLPGSVERLSEQRDSYAQKHGIWLFNGFLESPVDGRSIGEIVIGDNSDDYELVDAAGWIGDFLDAR
jgi:threonine aldolase